MEKEKIRSIVESLLFVSGEPLGFDRIAQVLKEVDKKLLREALAELIDEYVTLGRGLRIAEVAGAYQLQTAKENSEWLARLVKTRPIRLTRPSLETMAIIAYRQPVTRIEVDQIRGVDSSGVVKTLCDYGFIQVVGRKEVPGRPLVYGTSKKFLEFFRLKSLGDLPSLEEFVAQAEGVAADGELFKGRYTEGQEPAGAEGEAPAEGAPAEGAAAGAEPTEPVETTQSAEPPAEGGGEDAPSDSASETEPAQSSDPAEPPAEQPEEPPAGEGGEPQGEQ